MSTKTMFKAYKEDLKRNSNNPKGLLIMTLFRLAHAIRCSRYKFIVIIGLPYLIFYRLFVEWVLGVELPFKAIIGSGLVIHHGMSLVVHNKAVIGDNVTLRHNTTIGIKDINDFNNTASPVIGNNVNIGANSVLLGSITIGDDVIIGAGSVVTKSVPAGAVVVGNPARIVKWNYNFFKP